MKIRDGITIQASAQEVWNVLADLQRLPEWLPKCTAVLTEHQTPRVGSPFHLERTWKQETRVSDVVLREVRQAEHLGWQETIPLPNGTSCIQEDFRLIANRSGCRIRHTVDITKCGMPLWARCLMWFIHTVGRPTGKTGLMRLKELVEHESSP